MSVLHALSAMDSAYVGGDIEERKSWLIFPLSTSFTNTFSQYIDSGFGLLGGDVSFLSSTLVGIDLLLPG